jgi:3-dehydroquinate dehydratase type I
LIERHGSRLVVCARPERQGGKYRGDEGGRVGLLLEAARRGAAYVDLEADLSDSELERFRSLPTKVILSWHEFGGVKDEIGRRFQAMSERKHDLLKMAVQLDDVAQLATLRGLAASYGRPGRGSLLLIGMGPYGVLSRCRFRHFQSRWTYVAASAEQRTAAGQLTLDQALAMGLPQSADSPFVALIGGEQIAHSVGPRVYNQLFRRRGMPWSYVPVVCDDARSTIEILRELGALGCSVTMPHKAAAFERSLSDSTARRVGVANTLRFEGNQIRATNTDLIGVRAPLERAILGSAAGSGSRASSVLILGAGGAARAAAVACRELDLEVIISARRLDQAQALVKSMGESRISVLAWEERGCCTAPILINGTPFVGRSASPWPAGSALRQSIIFDLAIGEDKSALLTEGATAGATVIGPLAMWVAQGAAQIKWITGLDCSEADLVETLP